MLVEFGQRAALLGSFHIMFDIHHGPASGLFLFLFPLFKVGRWLRFLFPQRLTRLFDRAFVVNYIEFVVDGFDKASGWCLRQDAVDQIHGNGTLAIATGAQVPDAGPIMMWKKTSRNGVISASVHPDIHTHTH